MKNLSITDSKTAVRAVVKEIEHLQDSGIIVPRSLYNRWSRLYKQLKQLESK